jgi:hypothetical protein
MSSNTNRTKGHNGEREMAILFRENTVFDKCKTTRLSSKLLDDCGIDLDFIPVNIQVKTGIHKGLNPGGELQYIQDRMNELLEGPRLKAPKVLIHLKRSKGGKKKTPYQSLVHMTLEDFIIIFNKAYPNKEYL